MSRPENNDIVRQFTVGADDEGVRLDRWFKRHLPQVGFATVSRWARTGQIRVDGKRADVADRLSAGQVLRVPPGGEAKPGGKPAHVRRELSEEELELADSMVLTQDRAAIVLNKPPGLATQGGSGMKQHVDGLLDAYAPDGPRPRLVHRLDKDTSGVLLVARTPGSAAFFSKRFSGRSAKKIYWALVVGVPSISDGMIELPLAKQPGTGGEKMHVDEENGQPARTRYRVLDRAGNRAAWVELHPLTGRTHQLRVHMAAIGHPIVGDGKYGGQDAFLSGTISRKMHLHARRLIIDHPDGAPLDVTASLPEHFANSLEQLGFDEADGEMLPEAPVEPSKDEQKRAAKAHAKQYRKERRGERRSRRDTAPARGGKPGAGSAKPGKPARPGGKPGTGKPSGGKPAGSRPNGGKPGGASGGARKPGGPRGKR
ncbi:MULTISPECIES: RluA family pseudouridine synthase [Novosphingobium]|uniref:Ribosomal large subunit pseudouridine synthase D n=1 Tax=Novosphingobium mathurense TaxID=428990 RepID=A0A1U6GSZ8_9SPHN|nr:MULTISPECIES: RluA family pseudouridine synthase [Novosphingobium]CDO38833.1 Pseudouridine synthase [Novosphingobium sp. KN65.2]SLJ86637.1 ribosomal large subunit pseudouridine synthase C [Novosphingobium mathurense]